MMPKFNVPKELLDEISNKILSVKIMLRELYFSFNILRYFRDFHLNLFADAGGRAYPDNSTFNYLRPLFFMF